jgi:uncharacterized protein
MNKIRDILNEIKWKHNDDLRHIEIFYIHRGGQNDINVISGEDIISIDKTFIETMDAMIPHHRIFKITYKGKTVFDRKKDT